MELTKAIELLPGQSLAFVGAGGKTSAMFALAKLLHSPIVLTTTTHIGTWQTDLADEHLLLKPGETIPELNFSKGPILLVTGQPREDDRLSGLDKDALEALHSLCKSQNISLLIEADGARQRNLKAPADYEPNLPDWIERVVVIAGLASLGKPLIPENVHRPERFAALTGLRPGDLIRVEDIVFVLQSEQGGLKGIPPAAQRMLFLNQAEGAEHQAQAVRIARTLIPYYDRVIIGSLKASQPDDVISYVRAQTAGIILAAGGSQRLGRPKQLLNWQGVPFIRCVAQNALEAGLEPLVVVTGADSEQIEEVISDLPVIFVNNIEWQSGMSSSMKAGLSALPETCDSAMFLLADQPQISPHLISQLLERYAKNRASITAPRVNDRRGNPVLFSRKTFKALLAVTGDQGGRAVFNQFEVDWLPWMDARILMDVDEPGDDQALLDAYSQSE